MRSNKHRGLILHCTVLCQENTDPSQKASSQNLELLEYKANGYSGFHESLRYLYHPPSIKPGPLRRGKSYAAAWITL